MKLSELLYDFTIQVEMGINQVMQKKYHSTRSRRKDVIQVIKVTATRFEERMDNDFDREKMYGISLLFSNRLIDAFDDEDFYKYITELLQALKQLSSYQPPIMRETDADVKTYIPSRQQREVHTETDSRTKQTETKAIYEIPDVRPEIAPMPERPQMPQMPQGRVISSGLTPFR